MTTKETTAPQSIALPVLDAGETYAGLTIHNNTPMHLVLLPGDHDDATWKKAKAWAEELGGELPSRIDLLVLWQNLPGAFRKEWYWSGETRASDESDAWYQGFYGGSQLWGNELTKLRARAVRRLPI